ncbi:spore gernimation protein GerPD [Bacillus pseudomycoides]|uniref:Spore gernimation protein GerPD n=1 Tax=Bacillus pseudomycoides TaxID=64104 RepID=A0A2B4MRM0_9BACI|nr:spore gernimation protein GerPD [Bacillus pseudomycoides]PDY44035.1 spore gernimation protein GerPD [Bacillus pseudomycoides]PEA81895.1 spore gernimation protein GerPD [Bacillus pseudomycoides]PED05874.1 spore gernimation protein GerPD [Bacillus pseudomycoides]PED70511.1 spore gernimation protein GerPD [Bacillus pseudomycoides]PEI34390.1 spore gernimation protein GerPD [Bacillus pseudomycoides]
MNFNVVNCEMKVGQIKMNGVSSSALFLIGDANLLILSSILDTPFESMTEGPFVPLVTAVPTTPG